MEHVEVGVVGGGPAGSSAAAAAANRGAETVCFEQGVPREDRDELGPDSTDAAGFLDYWVDIADIDYRDIPESVILQELDCAEFIGPSESVVLKDTGMQASYPSFGFTFDRARFDDWLRSEAEAAGAEYRVGVQVRDVASDLDGNPTHELVLGNGERVTVDRLVLTDGPQRRTTIPVLDRLLPANRKASDVLSPPAANHIAYQEYRRFPAEIFEPDAIKFWWGWMPGETAYPWIFPNDDHIARVGFTMPIAVDLAEVTNRADYRLLEPADDRVPQGGTYVRRLLKEAYPDHRPDDFPIVEHRGKNGGTETYPISSTRPIESPVQAGIAVAGGAMGTTSAFHEGGDHVAIRSGKLAGRLAAEQRLAEYNRAWQKAIGDEILRNVAMADIVRHYKPGDWDRAFATARSMLETRDRTGAMDLFTWSKAAGVTGFRLAMAYKWRKMRFGNGRYVQLTEEDYTI